MPTNQIVKHNSLLSLQKETKFPNIPGKKKTNIFSIPSFELMNQKTTIPE